MPSPHRVALLAGLLLGAAASAQSISLNFVGSSQQVTTLAKGPAGCNDQVGVTWSTTGLNSANACTSLQIWVTNSASCGTGPGTPSSDGGTDLVIGTFSLATQAQGLANTFRVADMPGVIGNGGCSAIIDIPNAVCSSVDFRATGSNDLRHAQRREPHRPLRHHASRVAYHVPARPGREDRGPAREQQGDNDVLSYQMQYAVDAPWRIPQLDEPPRDPGHEDQRVDRRTDQRHHLRRPGASRSTRWTTSRAPSDEQTATPQASNGFWAEYKDAGGHDLGGCRARGAAVPSVLGALGVLVALLRRRR